MNRLVVTLTGLVTAIFGLSIITGPTFYDRLYGRYWDFTDVRVPFGGALILMGILFVWSALRKKAKDFGDKFMICPECKTPFNKTDVPNGRCPKCEVKVEDLEAFYERHPELKAR